MATEIVHWCDTHLASDERVPVSARHTVTLDGSTVVLELCETCEASMFKPFATFLGEHGVPERAAGKPVKASRAASPSSPPRVSAGADGRTLIAVPRAAGGGGVANGDRHLYPCIVCEGVIEGRHPYDRHLRDEHGTTHSALYGGTCPVCGQVCANTVGLATHGRGAHGVPADGGAFAVFDLARQQGDAHGIVAARLAAVAGA
jgi:hypothetical protein